MQPFSKSKLSHRQFQMTVFEWDACKWDVCRWNTGTVSV